MINTAFSVPLPFQTMPQTDTSGMASSFMQAYQMAKEQNDPLHKLRIATYEQDMQMKSLELSKALEDRQKTIDSEKRAREIAPTISGLLSAGKPYDAHMAILSETAKNPDLQFAPTWQGLGKSVGAAVTYQDKLEDNKRQAARDEVDKKYKESKSAGFTPPTTTTPQYDGQGNKIGELVQTGKGSYHFVAPKDDKLSATAQKGEEFAKLKSQEEQLSLALTKVQGWSPGETEKLKSELSTVQNKLRMYQGFKAHFSYDDQGRPIIDVGNGEPTVGTQTAIQTDLAGIKNSIVQIDRARASLSEKDVGLSGAIMDEVINKYVTQFFPEIGDPTTSSNRLQMQQAVETFLNSQEKKGRLSAAERAEIRSALVSRKPGESFPRAKSVLDTMSRIQKFDAITKATTAKQPLQEWMFNDLKKTDIRQLYKEGILNRDEAAQRVLKANE